MNGYILFGIGVFVGSIISNILFWFRTEKGVLLIDQHSKPDRVIYRIDLDDRLTDRTRRFVLKIDHNADLSQD